MNSSLPGTGFGLYDETRGDLYKQGPRCRIGFLSESIPEELLVGLSDHPVGRTLAYLEHHTRTSGGSLGTRAKVWAGRTTPSIYAWSKSYYPIKRSP
jgi:hypothetical protein